MERDHMEDVVVSEMIILKWILNWLIGRVLAVDVGNGAGYYVLCNSLSGSVKLEEILD